MSSLQEDARELLDRNAKRGKGYYYTAPSLRKYPHQWSWDSSFHAIANCRLGRADLGCEEIISLLDAIMPDGSLPHIIIRERGPAKLVTRLFRFYWPYGDRSPLVQPPVVALAAKDIWDNTEDKGFLAEVLPALELHFKWLGTKRRFGKSPLVSIFSPWESGLDHKPAFDKLLGCWVRVPFGRYIALYTSEFRLVQHRLDPKQVELKRYFNVREVLFNTIYSLGLEALAAMFAAVGDRYKSESCQALAQSIERAILKECRDAATGLYFDVDVNTGALIREPSVSCLMPLLLQNIPEEVCVKLLKYLMDEKHFWLSYPVPSVPRSSPHFRPDSRRYLWRGPTWINTNWLLVQGLRRHGYDEPAEAIVQASRSLVERAGFREYYNPLSGEGGGERDFGWSTLAAVM